MRLSLHPSLLRNGRTVPVLVTAVLVAALAHAAPAAAVGDEDTEVALPMTIEKVWYREQKRRFKAFKFAGDLTLTTVGLDFASKKKNLSFPLESISIISLGRLGKDVDTEWVILTLDHPGLPPMIAFRDGRRLGYGQRTQEIYDRLKKALRQLSAAQYRAPAGFEIYDRVDSRFTLAIPEGWSHFLHSSVYVDNFLKAGLLIFSPKRLAFGEDPAGDGPTVAEVQSGRALAFSAHLSAAVKGMRCDGFSDTAEGRLRDELRRAVSIEADPISQISKPLMPFSLGGCQGIRAEGRARSSEGRDFLWNLCAVSDGETLFIFVLRSDEEHYDDRRELFEIALESFRLVLGR